MRHDRQTQAAFGLLLLPAVPIGDLTFVVSDAAPAFTVTPNAAPIIASQTVTINGASLVPECTTLCAPPTVRFGNALATIVQIVSPTSIRVTVPQHIAGAVDVSVDNKSVSNAFRYFDPAAAPDDAIFEPILVPMLFEGPGALGSHWMTDLFIRNENPDTVVAYRSIYYTGCTFIFGFCPTEIGAGKTVQARPAPDLPKNGVIFRPLRQQADAIHFAARVRDTSRESDDFGSEMPIVRESQLRRGRVVLTDVIIDPRYRTTLRMHALDETARFDVKLFNGTEQVNVISAAATKGPGDEPWIATIDLSSSSAPRVTVEVTAQPGNTRMWAMASVTNNTTQHVTIISPQ